MSNAKISALTSATTPLAGTEVLPVVQSSATTQVTVANLTAGRAVSATQYTSTIATGTAPLVVSSTTNVANLNASSLGGATFAAPGAIGGGTASAITGTTITGTDTTDATSTTAAALKTAGGLAVVKKTYIGDNIVQGTAAKGLNFTANTPASGMTSQLLNWYEEGTWVPAIIFVTLGDLAITYSVQVGTYTRMGNRVTCNFNVQTSAFTYTTASGNLRLTGLPFTATSTSNNQSAGNMAFQGITKAGYTQIVPLVAATANYINLFASGSGVAISLVSTANMPTTSSVQLYGTVTYQI